MSSGGNKPVEWTSSDGLNYAQISTEPPEGMYPAMVRLQWLDFGSELLTAEDAKLLARKLNVAANLALRARA